MKKIAIIGAGNMGSAVAASLTGVDYEIICTAASQMTLNHVKTSLPDVKTTLSNKEAVRDADIVVLAVKPYLADEVCEDIVDDIKDDAVVISLMAGISTYDLCKMLHVDALRIYAGISSNLHIVRAIPNTAIRYGKSVTFIAFADNMPEEVVEEVVGIFNRSGKSFIVPESKMSACTSLASCGIAYFLRFIRAAVEGSIELGLRADFATEVAALTAEGAAALLAGGSHPEAEIDKVATPGGLTIRGLNTLEAHGLSAAVIAALKASTI